MADWRVTLAESYKDEKSMMSLGAICAKIATNVAHATILDGDMNKTESEARSPVMEQIDSTII